MQMTALSHRQVDIQKLNENINEYLPNLLAQRNPTVARYWFTLPQYGLLPSAIHNGLNYSHHRMLPSEQLQGVM